MKRKLLPLLLSFCGINALAQPTLTAATNAPEPGNASVIYSCNMVDPGPSGANQFWDFSGGAIGSAYPIAYFSCDEVADCGLFPGTTVVESLVGGNSFNYLQVSTEKQVLLGSSNDLYTAHYSDPLELMRFPFTYGDSYIDTTIGLYDMMVGIAKHHSGSLEVTADAYGSLKTPAGTFNDVLRIHQKRVSRDSTITPSDPDISEYVSETYRWYSAADQMFLYEIRMAVPGGLGANLAYFTSSSLSTNKINSLQEVLSVFPQPAHGSLKVHFQIQQPVQLSMQLTDISGRVVQAYPVQNFAAGQNEKTMDISHLSPGFYFLHILNGNQRLVTKKVQVL